jgi:hypothetical protein
LLICEEGQPNGSQTGGTNGSGRIFLQSLGRRDGRKEIQRRGVVAKCFAQVGKVVHVARPKHKASTQLKRILPELVLAMASRARTLSALDVVAAKQVEQIGGPESCRAIRFALFVNEQAKADAGLFTENSRIVPVAKTNVRERGSFIAKRLLVFAQLRDMLAAKDSPVMAQKNQNRRCRGPK